MHMLDVCCVNVLGRAQVWPFLNCIPEAKCVWCWAMIYKFLMNAWMTGLYAGTEFGADQEGLAWVIRITEELKIIQVNMGWAEMRGEAARFLLSRCG